MNGLMRMVMRAGMSAAMRLGMNVLEKRNQRKAGDDPQAQKMAREGNGRMRQAMRVLRRIGRF